MRCTRLAANTGRKKSPSWHHCTSLSGHIFATRHVSTIGKNLLSSNTSSTCPDNMVNFGQLTAEISSGVWAPLQISMALRLGSVTAQHLVVGFSQTAALDRGHHLCSAWRPAGWALASDHIVAQQANRYIVAFHIAIWYDTQRPPYNRRAVGLPPMRCMVSFDGPLYALTSALQRLTAACETH